MSESETQTKSFHSRHFCRNVLILIMKIPLTATLRASILDAMGKHKPKMSQEAFGDLMGHGKSWANKVLRPGPNALNYIDKADLDKAERILNKQLITFDDKAAPVSDLAIRVEAAALSNPSIVPILDNLLKLSVPQVSYIVPYLHPKALNRIGGEATKFVHRWDEADDPHYQKIGLEIVELLREVIAKEFPGATPHR